MPRATCQSTDRSTEIVRPQFHSSVRQTLFRVPSLQSPPAAFRERANLPGFLSSWRHHQCTSTERGDFQGSATFRPQAFSTSRRFIPCAGLWAYCVPLPRTGFLPIQGFRPPAQPPSLVGRSCPHVVARHPLTGEPAATRDALDFEALIRARMRSLGLVINLSFGRSPL
jgi:hypothetical protein